MTDRNSVAAIRAFNRFYTNVIGVVDRHILESPYSLTEVRILWEIDHAPGTNARMIREKLSIDEGYLSRTINRLVEKGLVRKRRSPADARVYELSLSTNGRKTFSRLNDKAGEEIAELVGALEPGEVRELVTHMERIREILSRADQTS